ncbi:VOC family protein [Thalassotalea sp. G2M2-11]|uniref:VOC family protein n=1 Tax=Thalassotalea sp. G2M2-11 TaxID=2787627 RepID=UPI0019D2FBA6|nr:VOC family protein [Thalassotalea sp. G2M2-11]
MIAHRHLRSICHASIGCNDLSEAKAFYQPLLAILNIDLVCDYPDAIAFGKGYPEFWVQIPYDKQTATSGNGVHFGFVASSTAQVDEFYRMAIALGAKDNGEPGPRKEYGDPYYGCFVIDKQGNKIEASYWHEAQSEQ